MRLSKILVCLDTAASVALRAACGTAPETGRSQLLPNRQAGARDATGHGPACAGEVKAMTPGC